ncbi:potassium channel family protein [Ferrovibrio sp.]|uniref:potassium channel family protein n=1 Tax=Ferrovibrio sp. TaxID=1917215 RepID=UPI003D12647A
MPRLISGPFRFSAGTRDWALSGMVLALLVVHFVLGPISDLGLLNRPVIGTLATLLVLTSLVATYTGTVIGYVTLFGGGLVCALQLLHLVHPEQSTTAALLLAGAAFLLLISVAILMDVFSRRRVNMHCIMGAVAVYLLLGLIWGLLYVTLELLSPGAFVYPSEAERGHRTFSNLLYFSFVTLTTVGYGDFLPLHPVARSLATAEALVGQLFPAVLLARLVSMEVTASSEKP